MPVFQPQIRTVQTWLAGIGASSSLLASALVCFIILVGAASFDSWPGPGDLFADGGNVTLNSSATEPGAPAPPPVPDLVTLLSPPGPAPVARTAGARGGERVVRPGPGEVRGGDVAPPGGAAPQPPVQTIQPPAPSPEPSGDSTARPRNVVQQTASSVGNTVEGTTTIVGDNLGGSDDGLGGVVAGAGKAVNNTVQGLVGTAD
jgi:hypothetical protein